MACAIRMLISKAHSISDMRIPDPLNLLNCICRPATYKWWYWAHKMSPPFQTQCRRWRFQILTTQCNTETRCQRQAERHGPCFKPSSPSSLEGKYNIIMMFSYMLGTNRQSALYLLQSSSLCSTCILSRLALASVSHLSFSIPSLYEPV